MKRGAMSMSKNNKNKSTKAWEVQDENCTFHTFAKGVALAEAQPEHDLTKAQAEAFVKLYPQLGKFRILFHRYDKSGNGVIDGQEFAALVKAFVHGKDDDGDMKHLETALSHYKLGITWSMVEGLVTEAFNGATKNEALCSALIKISVFSFVYLPIFAICLSAVLGGVLAAIEGWSFEDGFFEMLATISTTEIEVTEVVPAESHFARMMVIVFGAYGMATFACVAGILGGPLLSPVITAIAMEPSLTTRCGQKHPLLDALARLMFFTTFALPAAILVISAFMGALMMEAEKESGNGEWTFEVCFYAIGQELIGSAIDIIDIPPIEQTGGKIIACIVGLWSLIIFCVVLGVMGGPILDPLVTALKAEPKVNSTKRGSIELKSPKSAAKLLERGSLSRGGDPNEEKDASKEETKSPNMLPGTLDENGSPKSENISPKEFAAWEEKRGSMGSAVAASPEGVGAIAAPSPAAKVEVEV